MTAHVPTPVWPGVLYPDHLARSHVAQRMLLADAARAGDWDAVLSVLKAGQLSPNHWRPGGTSWFAPLHQAAWHGAPEEIIARLVELGAWRTLRNAKGMTALDLARDKGHRHLEPLLALPKPARRVQPEVLGWLDLQLAELVESRIRPHLGVWLRHPSAEVLTELPGHRLWYPVPGMYGGFRIELRENHLYVESWSRVVGGSGQAHLITQEGRVLVNQGFV